MRPRFAPLLLAASIATCLSLPTRAQTRPSSPEVQTSPAQVVAAASDQTRQALDAWLDAFNSNDRTRLEAFRDRYQPHLDVDGMLDFHAQTGGFRLLRYEPAVAGTAQALVQETDSETVARISVTMRQDEPPLLRIEATERPADLQIQRLDQAGAIAALFAKADADAGNDKFSGVLLVAREGKVVSQRAWGMADRANGTPVTMETKFRLGSMNKMFTAVATLQMVDAGKLSLDGTVGSYLPDYPNAEIAKVTIRQLLTHSGGTGDIFGPEFDKHRLTLKTHDDYVRLYGARAPTHPPGKEYRYSNYGFVLLGAIIEHVSGQSYYDYVDQHVFAAAGMKDTGSLPEDVQVPGRAHAYTRKDGQWVDAAGTLPWRGTAAGGGYSTATDLLKFARALQAGKLLPPTLLAEATRKQTPWYGYGFMVGKRQGVAGFGHGGGAEGMNGALEIFPAQQQVVIGLANVDPPEVERLADYYSARMPLGK